MVAVGLVAVVWLGLVATWIGALVSAVGTSDDAYAAAGRSKTATVLVIVLMGFLGALYYAIAIGPTLSGRARDSRWTKRGALVGGSTGGVIGLVVGLATHPATAWFAVLEVGLPATIVGAVAGFAIDALGPRGSSTDAVRSS